MSRPAIHLSHRKAPVSGLGEIAQTLHVQRESMAFVKNNATPLTSLGIFQATRFLVERCARTGPYPQ
jgi:hypothetical protein